VPDFGATSSARQAGVRSQGSSGQAQGQPAVEIFTSFHALVDSLSDEADSAKGADHAKKTNADDANDAPAAKETKNDKNDRVVVPIDIATVLLPRLAALKGRGLSLNGGVDPEGASSDPANAHDLALLLLGVKGASPNGVANLVAGDEAIDHASGLPLTAVANAATKAGSDADGAALAQEVIQKLLAAAAAGPQKLAAELASQAGVRPQTSVEELVKQIVQQADHSSNNASSAARLIAPHVSEISGALASSFAAAEAAATTGALLEPPSTTTADQIIQAIRLQWARGGGEAQIRLEPEHFGDLTISLRVDQGQVVARLQADTPIIREWLQANHHLLRQSLAEHNLTLARLEVSEPHNNETRNGTSRNGGQEQESREGKPARRPQTDEGDEVFEVMV
jgi:flagellar hook-length control protein FliK